jgi:hypothetical protein
MTKALSRCKPSSVYKSQSFDFLGLILKFIHSDFNDVNASGPDILTTATPARPCDVASA